MPIPPFANGSPTSLSGNFYAQANEADIRAKMSAANAAGGGTVYIPAGTISIAAALPVYESVSVVGAGAPFSQHGDGLVSGGTVLVAATPGAYHCFAYNAVDSAVPSTSISNFFSGELCNFGLYHLAISGFLDGVHVGSLYNIGVTNLRMDDVFIQNCYGNGVWFENGQNFDIGKLSIMNCGQSAFTAVGSGVWSGGSHGTWNMGNCYLGDLYVQQNRANTLATDTATFTSSNANIGVGSAANFSVGQAISFTSTPATGFLTSQTYYVQSINSGANTIQLSYPFNGPVITPSSTTTASISAWSGLSNACTRGVVFSARGADNFSTTLTGCELNDITVSKIQVNGGSWPTHSYASTMPVTASTTVTTGATSATQTVGSTSGWSAGQVVQTLSSGQIAVISSITNSTTVVFTAPITTVTGETIQLDLTRIPWDDMTKVNIGMCLVSASTTGGFTGNTPYFVGSVIPVTLGATTGACLVQLAASEGGQPIAATGSGPCTFKTNGGTSLLFGGLAGLPANYATTQVTTGATSATQTVTSTSGMYQGQIHILPGGTRVVNTVNSSTSVTYYASVVTSTNDTIQIYYPVWTGTGLTIPLLTNSRILTMDNESGGTIGVLNQNSSGCRIYCDILDNSPILSCVAVSQASTTNTIEFHKQIAALYIGSRGMNIFGQQPTNAYGPVGPGQLGWGMTWSSVMSGASLNLGGRGGWTGDLFFNGADTYHTLSTLWPFCFGSSWQASGTTLTSAMGGFITYTGSSGGNLTLPIITATNTSTPSNSGGNVGVVIAICNPASGSITINTSSSQTFNGTGSTSYTLAANSVTLFIASNNNGTLSWYTK